MKSYTDLEQSKKLAEFLPIESADHHYVRKTCDYMGNPVDGKWSEPKYGNPNSKHANYFVQNFTSYEKLPCWSLAALLGVLEHPRCFQGDNPTYWFCGCFKDKLYHEVEADNPIDACVEMIIKLYL